MNGASRNSPPKRSSLPKRPHSAPPGTTSTEIIKKVFGSPSEPPFRSPAPPWKGGGNAERDDYNVVNNEKNQKQKKKEKDEIETLKKDLKQKTVEQLKQLLTKKLKNYNLKIDIYEAHNGTPKTIKYLKTEVFKQCLDTAKVDKQIQDTIINYYLKNGYNSTKDTFKKVLTTKVLTQYTHFSNMEAEKTHVIAMEYKKRTTNQSTGTGANEAAADPFPPPPPNNNSVGSAATKAATVGTRHNVEQDDGSKDIKTITEQKTSLKAALSKNEENRKTALKDFNTCMGYLKECDTLNAQIKANNLASDFVKIEYPQNEYKDHEQLQEIEIKDLQDAIIVSAQQIETTRQRKQTVLDMAGNSIKELGQKSTAIQRHNTEIETLKPQFAFEDKSYLNNEKIEPNPVEQDINALLQRLKTNINNLEDPKISNLNAIQKELKDSKIENNNAYKECLASFGNKVTQFITINTTSVDNTGSLDEQINRLESAKNKLEMIVDQSEIENITNKLKEKIEETSEKITALNRKKLENEEIEAHQKQDAFTTRFVRFLIKQNKIMDVIQLKRTDLQTLTSELNQSFEKINLDLLNTLLEEIIKSDPTQVPVKDPFEQAVDIFATKSTG